jgi:DNA topoisomerase-1
MEIAPCLRMTILEQLQDSGIRRIGSVRSGFRYRPASGGRLRTADRRRIDALRIPPAWVDVHVHPAPDAAVQAVGRDAAGRWQYLYHAKQTARRERTKLERLRRFVRALPALRRDVARDLARPGLERERVLAGAVRILGTCFLRPGGEVYASEHGSFGLATLRPRHVSVRGDTITLDFNGKSGKRQTREFRDRAVAKLLRELLKHRGRVFQYRNGGERLVDVKSHHINDYIRERTGQRFTAKDFRTWAGSLLCAAALARTAPEARASATARKRAVAAAMREVSEHLGNTPAVCRASYVFPVVVQRFESGRVMRRTLAGLTPRRAREVERCERAFLALIDEPRAAARRRRAA